MRLIYYVETNLICITIVLCTMYYMNSLTSRNETSIQIFIRMLWLLLVYCLSDIAAVFLSGSVFKGSWLLSQTVNIIYFLIPVILAYLWFSYIQVRLRKTDVKKSVGFIRMIPMFYGVISILLNPLTGFYFTIDTSNLYHRGPGVVMHWVVCWLYYLLTFFQVLKELKNETNEFKRREYKNYSLFIFPIAVTALIQMFVYGVTSSQLGFVFATVIVFFSTQQTLVHKDELTGLNNRNSLIAFKNSLFQSSSSEHDISIIMIDMDHFKSINDQYGHLSGDEALKHVSDALMRAASSIKSTRFLLYRFGGDEFVMVGVGTSDETVALLIEAINREIALENTLITKGYQLSISVGMAKGTCHSASDFSKIADEADKNMYKEK